MLHGFPSKTVRQVGEAKDGACDYAITEVCCADPKGRVQPYVLVDENQQWLICTNCLNRLLQSGRWILETKAGKAADE